MADCDGRVLFQQHHCHRLAENGTAANHHGVLALDIDIVVLQDTHDALWRCATISILTHGHPAKAQAGDSIHIFTQGNGVKTGALVNLLGYRVLQQDAVHIGVAVQLVNFGE